MEDDKGKHLMEQEPIRQNEEKLQDWLDNNQALDEIIDAGPVQPNAVDPKQVAETLEFLKK